MNPQYAMKPLWKATWYISIVSFRKVDLETCPLRYYWKVVELKQVQRTYIEPQTLCINFRQNRDSPTPQHSIGMFKRFAKLNGITHYRIINNKEK